MGRDEGGRIQRVGREEWGEIGALTLFMATLLNRFQLSPKYSLSVVSVVSYSAQNPVGEGALGAVGRSGRMGRVGSDWEEWEECEEIGKSGERLGRAGGDWEGIGLGFRSCFHSFPISSLPTHPTPPALRGFGGFVVHPEPSGERGVGRSGKIGKAGKNGKSGQSGNRLGRDREEIGKSCESLGRGRVRAPLMFPLIPNHFPLFPLSAVSVVSYPNPNPVGKGAWGAVGRSERMGRVGSDREVWEYWGEIGKG